MGSVIVIEQQSIFDIAIQQYGSVEGVVHLMNDNPNLTFNSNIIPGQNLILNDEAIDADIVNYFRQKQLKIATKGTKVGGDFDENDFDENDFNT